MPPRQGLSLPRVNRIYQLSAINPRLWKLISQHIPSSVPSHKLQKLNAGAAECCSWFITQQMQSEESKRSAQAVRSNSKKELSSFQKLAKALQEASRAWNDVKGFHNDLLSNMEQFATLCDGLEDMATEAQRRNAGLESLLKLNKIKSPRDEFVRKVASCFKKEKIPTPASGRAYDETSNDPSWFQMFIADLCSEFLDMELKCRGFNPLNPSGGEKAFFSMVAKAMAGDSKPAISGDASPD